MTPDWSLCAREPRPHQRLGVELVLEKETFAFFDQMGVGKTKQRVDATQFEYVLGKIDTAVVFCPAQVGSVWADPDPDIGELVKDLWPSIDHEIHTFCGETPDIAWRRGALNWVVVNYEFVRQSVRVVRGRVTGTFLDPLMRQLVGRRFVFVAEESGAVKSWKAQQTVASFCVRYQSGCRGASLLNGTPVDHSPLDVYSQARVLRQGIYPQANFMHFRAMYAVVVTRGGYPVVDGYQNLEDLRARFAPWGIRRLKTEVWDLHEKVLLPPIEVPMEKPAWRLYKDLRDDCLASLPSGGQVLAESGAVKVIRLLQLCNGFLGGVEYWDLPEQIGIDWVAEEGAPTGQLELEPPEVVGVGGAKTASVVDWVRRLPEHDKALVWCRFRRQVDEVAEALERAGVATRVIKGGQKRAERRDAVAFVGPANIGLPEKRVLVGLPSAGGLGLNFTAASHTLYASHEWSLKFRLQTEDRVHRPPQPEVCDYVDMVACGPDGQKTVEHAVRAGLLKKEDVATWTCEAWRRAIGTEK